MSREDVLVEALEAIRNGKTADGVRLRDGHEMQRFAYRVLEAARATPQTPAATVNCLCRGPGTGHDRGCPAAQTPVVDPGVRGKDSTAVPGDRHPAVAVPRLGGTFSKRDVFQEVSDIVRRRSPEAWQLLNVGAVTEIARLIEASPADGDSDSASARTRASTGRAVRPAREVAHEVTGCDPTAGNHWVICDWATKAIEADRRATYLETPGADGKCACPRPCCCSRCCHCGGVSRACVENRTGSTGK